MIMESDNLVTMNREELEQLAMIRVCACMYYDLADTLGETPDEDLIKVINHDYDCEGCGLKALSE
jgi:hypothetical protein